MEVLWQQRCNYDAGARESERSQQTLGNLLAVMERTNLAAAVTINSAGISCP